MFRLTVIIILLSNSANTWQWETNVKIRITANYNLFAIHLQILGITPETSNDNVKSQD